MFRLEINQLLPSDACHLAAAGNQAAAERWEMLDEEDAMKARIALLPLLLVLFACDRSDEDQLQEAAEQSDPAAARVLNQAAEAGIPPQEALERAGEAQAQQNVETSSTVQARPNLPQEPNRPEGGQPPETVDVAEEVEPEDEHAGHDMANAQ